MRKPQKIAAMLFGRPEPHAWTNRTAPSYFSPYAMAYSPQLNRMVQVGYFNNSGNPTSPIAYSDDGGKTWTTVTPPAWVFSRTFEDVIWCDYSGGMFVAVANDTTECNVATSADGVTWSYYLITAKTPRRVHYDGSYFHIGCVAAGYYRATNITSLASWTLATTAPDVSSIQGFAGNGSRVVAVGNNASGNTMSYSDDNGDNWTDGNINSGYQWSDVLYSTKLSLFIAVAESRDAGATTTYAATSATGAGGSWTLRTTHGASASVGLTKLAQTSDDADTYTICATAYNDANTAPIVKTTVNATTWTNRTPSLTGGVYAHAPVAYSLFDEQFCVTKSQAGFPGQVMTSTIGS